MGRPPGQWRTPPRASRRTSRVDLGVEHEGPSGAASQSRRPSRSSSERAVRPWQPAARAERGEVGVGELGEVDGLAHRAEVVDLGAVRGVVVDDDEHRQAEAPERLELGQRHQRAAVAERGDGQAVGPRDRRPDRVAEREATHWKACGKTKPGGVGHAQVHRRPAHEGARVDDDRALGGQQVVERDAQRARVEHAGRPALARRARRASAAPAISRRQLGRAPRGAGRARGPQRGQQRLGRRRGVADHPQRRPAGARRSPPRRGRPGRRSRRAPSSFPCRVVHWFSAAPKATTTSASPSSRAASGAAKPPEMPRS